MLDLSLRLSVGLTPAMIEAAVQSGHETAIVEIADVLLEAARQTILTGIDPYGEAWKPHDKDTRSPTGQIGVRSGAMLASLFAVTEVSPGVIRAEVSIGAEYSKYFQGQRAILPLAYDRGFTARGRRSRRRVQTVDLPPALLEQCIAIDLRHVTAAIEEARRTAQPVEV